MCQHHILDILQRTTAVKTCLLEVEPNAPTAAKPVREREDILAESQS